VNRLSDRSRKLSGRRLSDRSTRLYGLSERQLIDVRLMKICRRRWLLINSYRKSSD
jgi:hypothetical protein